MTVTTTAVGFCLLATGLAACGWRFLSALKKSGEPEGSGRTGRLIGLQFIGFAIQNGIIGLGSLFFANNPKLLGISLASGTLILSLVAALGVYLVLYINHPKGWPWLPVGLVLTFGIIATVFSFISPSYPFITKSGGLDFGMPTGVATLVYYLLLTGIGSSLFIFLNTFLHTKSRDVKIIAGILSSLSISGIANVFFRLILINTENTSSYIKVFDVSSGIIGLVFLVAFVLLPKILNVKK